MTNPSFKQKLQALVDARDASINEPIGDSDLIERLIESARRSRELSDLLFHAAPAILELLEAAEIAAPFLEGMSEAYRMQGKAYEVPAKVAVELRKALSALEASNG